MATISVIMATYNGASWIGKQLDSIVNQTLPPAEIIICDDRSTDATAKILESYASHPLVSIFINEQQLGVTANFRKACSLCNPEHFVAFADQDDIWVPMKLEHLWKEMNNLMPGDKPALVFSDLAVIDADDRVIAPSFWERQQINIAHLQFSTLLFGNAVTGCTMLINPAMADEFKKVESAGFLHDAWLALIAYSFGKAKLVREQLVLYRQHTSNLTFPENYEGPSFKNSLKAVFNFATGKKQFLGERIALAKHFLSVYGDRLSLKDKHNLQKFIELEHKSYPVKRLHRYLASRR